MNLGVRGLLSAAAAAALLGTPLSAAAASPSPSPSPSPFPSACPSASPLPAPAKAPAPAPSPDAAELCRQQQAVDQARARLTSDLAAAQAASQQLQQSLDTNAKQQAEIADLIRANAESIARLDISIGQLDAEIAATQLRIDAERRHLVVVERALYRLPASPLIAVLEAGSLQEAVLQLGDIASIGIRGEQIRRGLEADQARLRLQVDAQRADREHQAALRVEREKQLERIAQLRREQEVTGAQLTLKISQSRAQLRRLDAQSADLANRIAAEIAAEEDALIAAAAKQAWQQTLAWLAANPVGALPLSAGHSTQYRLIWPEPQAQVSQPFGPSDLALEPPYAGYPHFHTGIDLVEPDLSPIYAADDGVVAGVGSGTTGYGNYVVIAHAGGLLTLYGHLERSVVKVGDAVMQGQPIGLEGSTGNSTGPHLHFEVRTGGNPVDPRVFLPPGPSPARG